MKFYRDIFKYILQENHVKNKKPKEWMYKPISRSTWTFYNVKFPSRINLWNL